MTKDMKTVPGRFAVVFFTPKNTMKYTQNIQRPYGAAKRGFALLTSAEEDAIVQGKKKKARKEKKFRRGKKLGQSVVSK